MLRKRSRPVPSSKQTTVSDHNNFPSPSSEKSQKSIYFLFNSPRIFKDLFSSKEQPIMSPSSVLDTKPFCSAFSSSPPLCLENKIQNPKAFSSSKHPQHHQHSWEQPGIGLALIDDHGDEKNSEPGPTLTSKNSEQKSKLVVFGSQLKIQIPPQAALFSPTSPQSPMEFGIKTPKSNLLGVFGNSIQQEDHYKDKKRLSVKDMELSEDYTCVISHGPNPKTTHIFGNCIVKSCCDAVSNSASAATAPTNGFSTGLRGKAEKKFISQRNRDFPASEYFSFLSFCHHCNRKIGQGKDVYMYRGERAFCSQECRGQEMLFDGTES